MSFGPGSAEIPLIGADPVHQGQAWKFTLGYDTVRLWNANGELVAEFSPELATQAFEFPSFSESIRHFSVQLPESRLRFDVDKKHLDYLRTFANLATISAGPAAVRAVRNKALRDLVLGIGAIAAGALLAGAVLTQVKRVRGLKIVVVLVVVGVSMTAKGVYGYRQYRTMQRLV